MNRFRLDLSVTNYATFDDLEDYCKRTSSVLSMLCTQVLGYQSENTLKYAEQSGIALQLAYILLKMRSDVIKGRIYIPQEELVRFGVSKQTLFNYQLSEQVQALLAYQVTRIRAYYYNSFKYLSKKERYNQRSSLIRAQLTLATLQEIENDGFQLFKHRICLTPLRKLWISWRTNLQAKAW